MHVYAQDEDLQPLCPVHFGTRVHLHDFRETQGSNAFLVVIANPCRYLKKQIYAQHAAVDCKDLLELPCRPRIKCNNCLCPESVERLEGGCSRPSLWGDWEASHVYSGITPITRPA